jgi:Protein of unknown function (DUF982)
MKDNLSFFTPVCVKTGESVQLIESVRDAMRFLYGWPSHRRGPAFGCALRSADAAIAGRLSVEKARQAFVSFASIAEILAKSDEAAVRRGSRGPGCPACGSLTVDLPDGVENTTVVYCDRCGHRLGAWGDLQQRLRRIGNGVFEISQDRSKPI